MVAATPSAPSTKRKRAPELPLTPVSMSPTPSEEKQRVPSSSDRRPHPAKRAKTTPTKKASNTPPAKTPKRKRAASAVPPRLVGASDAGNGTRSPSARSRSTTEFGSLEDIIPRECSTTHDGWFTDIISAETVVKKLMHSYKSYFKNPDDPTDKSFEPHPINFPFVELEYPNTNARERFPLLVPKDEDHYSPVKEVKKSLFTIIETYLSPSQAALFGTPPGQLRPSDFTPPKSDSLVSSSPGRSKSRPSSRSVSPVPPSNDLLRTLVWANNQRDGPLFVSTFQKISELLRAIKKGEYDEDGFRVDADTDDQMGDRPQLRPTSDPNPMRKLFQSWKGVSPVIWKTIVDETYQRAVGPNIPLLRKYQAWSSEAYGELETDFVSDIVHYVGLTPSSNFFDMGSGVGTVVLQAALQAGCTASGIEKSPNPAAIAKDHLPQFQKRCRMWGVEPGDLELLEGDFTDDHRVMEKMKNADLVLCNNYAFTEPLNQALLHHFLDMKEGAVVISLRSFVPPDFRLTDRTINSPAAILRVEERSFRAGSVSWMPRAGVYFINTIDRSLLTAYLNEVNAETPNAGTVRRSRTPRSRR
ncbi:DOT1-domain-containing protein [Hysterangium stoloniferum]|nr:DOT1-domain-containing protein [Hysterangium stoloniferum]